MQKTTRSLLPMNQTIKINEIFYSIQGESIFSGYPTVFIRLTGCPLRCQYCDTAYAFNKGNNLTILDIKKQIESHNTPYICVSGGEPLSQPMVHPLMTALCDQQFIVSIETSGALDISNIDQRVHIIMDIKTPGSKESSKNLINNLAHLKLTDQLKFVICNEEDFHWSQQFIIDHDLKNKCPIWFSPSHEEMPASTLADLILKYSAPVRLQVQLHKFLWGNKPGC